MGITFSKAQFGLGHPLTIFLNDRSVFIASTVNAPRFAEHQKTLADLMSKGVTVIVCPMCMDHYGIQQANMVEGLQVGKPELTGPALFNDNTKALTW
jgi:sulfur relay (sulfurtransferase) complex TusBCD TusD component (DsrE family)